MVIIVYVNDTTYPIYKGILCTLLVLITLSISLKGPIIPPPLTVLTDCGLNYTTVELNTKPDKTDG